MILVDHAFAKCMKISYKKISNLLIVSNKNRLRTARRVVARDQNCHIMVATLTQCVELKLRWRFYVHASTCPEIYFWLMFRIIFDISNTRSWLGFAQKQIWNIQCGLSMTSWSIHTLLMQLSLKKQTIAISEDNFFNNVSNMLFYQILVKIWCLKHQNDLTVC